MSKISTFLTDFVKDESGISSVEYALLLAFVGGGVIAGATVLSESVNNQMQGTAQCISDKDETLC